MSPRVRSQRLGLEVIRVFFLRIAGSPTTVTGPTVLLLYDMASCSTIPKARGYPFIAGAGDKVYMWGGKGYTEPETVFLYRYNTETWARQLTKGPHPPAGLCCGCCTILSKHFYLYGGYEEKKWIMDTCINLTLRYGDGRRFVMIVVLLEDLGKSMDAG